MIKMKKVAFVSGSTRGVGLSIATSLVNAGYVVYINGRDAETVNKIAKELNVHPIVADMTNESQLELALEKIMLEQSQLDLVVANVGSGKSMLGWDIPLSEYQRIFDLNFFSTVLLATKAAKHMQKNGGHIIGIASIAGCESIGAPLPYMAAKTAVLSYLKGLSDVLAPKIRVNAISPGNMLTVGGTWDSRNQQDPSAVKEYLNNHVPLKQFVEIDNIANTVLFLDRNSSITGSNIVVDGGQIRKIV